MARILRGEIRWAERSLKTSWLSQIRTLAVERIGRRLGVAPAEELARVIDGIHEIIG